MSIESHLATPEISLDLHVRRCQIALARTLNHRKAIYLDLNYWITIRETAAGIRTSTLEFELLDLVRNVVGSGKAFCPISESIFAELLKKGDGPTREVTAKLVDDLSLGVSLIPFEMRIGTELAHWIYSQTDPNNVDPLDDLMWTKLNYVLGYLHPSDALFDQKTELAIQKAFFDHSWNTSLVDMTKAIGNATPPKNDLDALALRLNREKAKYAHEVRSFEQAYAAEIRGVIDIYGEQAIDIVNDMAKKGAEKPIERGSDQWIEVERLWKNLLVKAFQKKAETKSALRTMHILACLHASFRRDNLRQFEGNDFFDFHHASGAIGYCDAFFTERSLRTITTAKNVALDARFGCSVCAEVPDAVAWLKSIL